jgi:hypothetical protein
VRRVWPQLVAPWGAAPVSHFDPAPFANQASDLAENLAMVAWEVEDEKLAAEIQAHAATVLAVAQALRDKADA